MSASRREELERRYRQLEQRVGAAPPASPPPPAPPPPEPGPPASPPPQRGAASPVLKIAGGGLVLLALCLLVWLMTRPAPPRPTPTAPSAPAPAATPAAAASAPAAPQPQATAPAAAAAHWLIMVYMAADNDLDSFAMGNLEAMQAVGSSDKVKVAVLADRASAKSASWTTTRRMLIRNRAESGRDSWDPALPTCQDLGEQNTADPNLLRDFVTWAEATYPAEKRMLILWNHGGGWKAGPASPDTVAPVRVRNAFGLLTRPRKPGPKEICADATSGDVLRNCEIRQALGDLPRLDILACDACLMGMVEVAYEWRNLAGIFIGSEEVIPGTGWPYEPILGALRQRPDMPPRELAQTIVEAYGRQYANADIPTKCTLSAVDLPQMPLLVQAINGFVTQATGRSLPAQTRAPSSAPPIYPRGREDACYWDLGSLMTAFTQKPDLPAGMQQAASTVKSALARVVMATYSHPEAGGTGLSIYAAAPSADYAPGFIQFAADTQWDEFLSAMTGGTRALAQDETPIRRWAVLIGVEKYEDPAISSLRYTVDDVELLAKVLVENAGYPRDQVLTLTDTQATIENVRSLLGTQLPKKVAKDDMVLVYFSGHGGAEPALKDSDDGTEKYLLLANSKAEDLYTTALPMVELGRIFQRIQAKRLLFLLDACYSGAAGARGYARAGMKAGGLSDNYLATLAATEGAVVLTASRANEISMESAELGHGVFTYHLAQALGGKADTNQDGCVQLSELYQHLTTNVPAEAKKLGALQNPVLKGELSGAFPLTAPTRPTAPLK